MRLTRRSLLRGFALSGMAPVAAVVGGPAADASPQATRWFGTSVEGRRLVATCHGDPAAERRVLVVGVIHGSEPAGLSVVGRIARRRVPDGVGIWLVDAMNPDGLVRGTRQNARGVDLNRNFPTRWAPAGHPFDVYYPGPHAASEPETRGAMSLVRALSPDVTIYYHQHLDLVDLSGGSADIERVYARRVGMVASRLTRYGGSACTWADTVHADRTAFCVELPARVTGVTADRHCSAVLALAADLARGTRVRP